MAQLRRVHADRDQSRNRQKYARRRQPTLRPANLAGVGGSLWPAQKTVISVIAQSSQLLTTAVRILSVNGIVSHSIDKKGEDQVKLSAVPFDASPDPGLNLLASATDYFSNLSSI